MIEWIDATEDCGEENMKLKFIKAKITVDEYGNYGLQCDLDDYSFKYPSITGKREEIEKLARLINYGEVSICHIHDIIEDFIE